ncbi:MAG: rhodanese-like domain-containing protein [Pseudodesulfovibrio sp.]|uniref:rhodanese-like domain-containing protein n=1 Tax=Pseudodesulfovibrio sp. TaxID=2035812 RepID=UPI003D0C21E9
MISPKDTPDAPGSLTGTDRQLFHLKSLYEASSALAVPARPADLLRAFLPVAMGPLGLTFGFGILLHAGALTIESLGLQPPAADLYRASGLDLVHKFFPEDAAPAHPSRPVILAGEHLSHDPNLPMGTAAVIALSMGAGTHAVLGFGPKVAGVPLDADETRLLDGLASVLGHALNNATAMECVRDLNTSLARKNDDLHRALEESERAREALSRHTLQLRALYETTLEMIDIHEPGGILDAFLLSLMGTLSFTGGWIALYGPGHGRAEAVCRGLAPCVREELVSETGRGAVLARFVALKDRIPHANHACLVDDPEERQALPAQADAAVLFTLDQGWQGAIGLSAPLSGERDDELLDEDARQLLHSLVANFMVTLGNARQLDLIRELNSELAARNVDLQTTLDALTSAKREIDVQTKAKEHLVALVHGEVERVWRASWLDICLILLAGATLGILYNLSSPGGIDLVPKSLLAPPPVMIEAAEARRLARDDKAVIIDARPGDFFLQGHIPDAVNLPEDLFEFVYSMKLSDLDPAVPLLVYGRNISRRYDADVARQLELLGHERVLLIKGGLDAWNGLGPEEAP